MKTTVQPDDPTGVVLPLRGAAHPDHGQHCGCRRWNVPVGLCTCARARHARRTAGPSTTAPHPQVDPDPTPRGAA